SFWSTVASMPTARAALAAVTGADGRIYAIGGFSATRGFVNTVEAYTPSTNSWSTVAPMPTPRALLAATTGPDGRIYAIGGVNFASTLVRKSTGLNSSHDKMSNAARCFSRRHAL